MRIILEIGKIFRNTLKIHFSPLKYILELNGFQFSEKKIKGKSAPRDFEGPKMMPFFKFFRKY